MKRDNHLSDNLKAYQREQGKTLSEFSRDIGVAKSTLQSVMVDGNTTVDTLIRIANALGVTLDELVFGNIQRVEIDTVRKVLSEVEWYVQIPGDKQEKMVYHLSELMKLIEEAK